MAPPERPRRLLTDWTTSAGVDGTGLLALVLGGATAEGIHLATLGYETFVLHADDVSAEAAQTAAHVHHVVADPAALPAEWDLRFDLVVSLDGTVVTDPVAAAGLLFVISVAPVVVEPALTQALQESLADPADPARSVFRTIAARLD